MNGKQRYSGAIINLVVGWVTNDTGLIREGAARGIGDIEVVVGEEGK